MNEQDLKTLPKIELLQHSSSSYGPRTWANAQAADLTIAVAVDYSTLGEQLTEKAAGRNYLKLPFGGDILKQSRELYVACRRRNAHHINVAGNGIATFHKHNITQDQVNQYIYMLFAIMHPHWSINMIRSGGQTGADIAAAVVARHLGYNATILFPKGFKQRDIHGNDLVDQDPDAIYEWIFAQHVDYVR